VSKEEVTSLWRNIQGFQPNVLRPGLQLGFKDFIDQI
jgi:hypothetical protein